MGADGSQSTNLLIKNGALLCTGAEDIIGRFEKEYLGALNPFLLKVRPEVNMMDVLTELKVSAVAPSDDIFNVPRPKKTSKPESVKPEPVKEEANLLPEMPVFDAELLKLYKKIPTVGDCTVESLTDADTNLRAVMKLLLKLEMGRFIVMLPGERVKRNTK